MFVKPRFTFSKSFLTKNDLVLCWFWFTQAQTGLSDLDKAWAKRSGISFLRRENPKRQKAVKANWFDMLKCGNEFASFEFGSRRLAVSFPGFEWLMLQLAFMMMFAVVLCVSVCMQSRPIMFDDCSMHAICLGASTTTGFTSSNHKPKKQY